MAHNFLYLSLRDGRVESPLRRIKQRILPFLDTAFCIKSLSSRGLAAILCKLLDPGTRQRGLLLLRPPLDVNLLLSLKPIGLKITRLEEPQTQPSTSRRILQPSQDGEQQRQDTLKRCTEATTVVHTVHGWALRLWNRWRPPTRQNQSLTLWWRLRTEWTVGAQSRAMTYLSRLT